GHEQAEQQVAHGTPPSVGAARQPAWPPARGAKSATAGLDSRARSLCLTRLDSRRGPAAGRPSGRLPLAQRVFSFRSGTGRLSSLASPPHVAARVAGGKPRIS